MPDFRKTNINGKMYDVCSLENYISNSDSYDASVTAINIGDMVYPIKNKNDNRPGIYVGGVVSVTKDPTTNVNEYLASNIIDLNNLTDIRDAMNKQKMIKDMEAEGLSNPDNITVCPIDEQCDSPAMIGLKMALNKKHFDMDSYSQRWEGNYNNDRRLVLKAPPKDKNNPKSKDKHTISLQKIQSIAEKTDMKVTITFEDASPDVPNPMGEPISIVLTGGED